MPEQASQRMSEVMSKYSKNYMFQIGCQTLCHRTPNKMQEHMCRIECQVTWQIECVRSNAR